MVTLSSQDGGKVRILHEDSCSEVSFPDDMDFLSSWTMSSPRVKRRGKHNLTRNIYRVMELGTMIHKHWDSAGANHTRKHEDLKRKKEKLNFSFAICLFLYPGMKTSLKRDNYRCWQLSWQWNEDKMTAMCNSQPTPLSPCLQFPILCCSQLHWS